MTEIHGFRDERFRPLADEFRTNLDSGLDKGASLAVTLNGEPVVDLWGGTRDHERTVPWEADTVARVFSTSKVMVIICVLILVDRGLLDLDEPIATYWPDFARNGKGGITARQVLVHRSGLPGFGQAMPFADMARWTDVIALLEQAEPWYEPGTISCYHPMTYGFVLGELVQRVAHVAFEDFFRRESAGRSAPTSSSRSRHPRTSLGLRRSWPPDATAADDEVVVTDIEIVTADGMGDRAMGEINVADASDPRLVHVVAPSGTGITNARAPRGSDRSSPAERRRRWSPLPERVDHRAGRHRAELREGSRPRTGQRYGIGFGLDSKFYRAPTPTTLHWGGFGGSFLTMDPATGISCGLAPNQLVFDGESRADPRRVEYWRLLGEISETV